ncbi:unnamed protein product [Colias eurytheme]|nr:unnamed protein product [Colias eurytheme]
MSSLNVNTLEREKARRRRLQGAAPLSLNTYVSAPRYVRCVLCARRPTGGSWLQYPEERLHRLLSAACEPEPLDCTYAAGNTFAWLYEALSFLKDQSSSECWSVYRQW